MASQWIYGPKQEAYLVRRKRENEKSYLGEIPEVNIFWIDPTANGLVGDVGAGHELNNHGPQEATRDPVLHPLHGFQGLHI